MRDARINQIGEGANEVLKAFIAVVGMRDVGMGLMATAQALQDPTRAIQALWSFGREHAGRLVVKPEVPVSSSDLATEAAELASRVRVFGWTVERTLFAHRDNPEAFLDRQYIHERITDAAIALVTSACTLARLDSATIHGTLSPLDRASGRFFLAMARRRFDLALAELKENDDALQTEAADAAIGANVLG
jgi:hypothetical protein